jgi:hypothetical protein
VKRAVWRALKPNGWLAVLLLGGAGLAHGAAPEQPCGQAGCGAGGIDPAAVRAVLRSTARETARDAGGARPGGSPALPPEESAAGAWERRLGGPGKREDYDCALSFGVGGTLGGDGFLASRLLGRTQVWRDKLNRK